MPQLRVWNPQTSMPGTMRKLGPKLLKCRPNIAMEPVDKFLTKMYHTNSHFVFTVTRDFVRNCQTPCLVGRYPTAVAMEAAMLALKAEVDMFQWNEPKVWIPFSRASDPLISPGRISPLLLETASIWQRGGRKFCCRAAESVENRRPLMDDQRRRNPH
jgi:hypothetical protein